MSREVMQQALEALENINNWLPTIGQRGLRDYEADAITSIKEALAQPYPEYDRGFSNGWDKCAERQAVQPEPPAKRPVTNRCPKCVGLSCLCDGSCIKQEPVQEHPEKMARLGWQYVECPACGSEGARAFPKPEEQPVGVVQCVSISGEPMQDSRGVEWLAGRPIQEIFVGLADYICPGAGTVDEGIAREAYIETIIELATEGLTDLSTFTPDQMQTVFELYATHAIEARICNDIGTKAVTMPTDVQAAHRVEAQLRDFIRGGVSDALTRARAESPNLTPERIQSFVDTVYESAFSILQTLGQAEVDQ